MNTELLEELTEIEKLLTDLIQLDNEVIDEVNYAGDINLYDLVPLRDKIRGRINAMIHTGRDDYEHHRPAE